MKDDQRVILTKRLLKDGLLELLKTRDLGKITVTELCEQSGVNRATFYRHYEQPRDILSELRRKISQDVKALSADNDPKEDLKGWLVATCNYFYDNAELLNVLFRCRTDEEFVGLLNELYKDRIADLRSKEDNREVDDDSLKLATYFYAGGIYYILRQWLSEPINKTPEEVAGLLQRFMNVQE